MNRFSYLAGLVLMCALGSSAQAAGGLLVGGGRAPLVGSQLNAPVLRAPVLVRSQLVTSQPVLVQPQLVSPVPVLSRPVVVRRAAPLVGGRRTLIR